MTSIHPHLDRRWFAGFVLAAAALFILVPRIPQDEAYHRFADGRAIAGVPNFWNVISNLPFAVIGMLGLWKLHGLTNRVLFSGVLLTCFGSAYYHWAPTDARLVWDRLPMTVIFMSFLAGVITAKRGTESTARILALLLMLGVGSVVWWSLTNDLRPYAVIKYGPILFLQPFLWSSTERPYLWAVLGQHLVAGLATFCILRWRLIHNRSFESPISAEESMVTIRASHEN